MNKAIGYWEGKMQILPLVRIVISRMYATAKSENWIILNLPVSMESLIQVGGTCSLPHGMDEAFSSDAMTWF